jgi:hypothetical protein
MNLRELVATLECGGKPECSEAPVMIVDTDGRIYGIEGVEFQPSESFEGTRSDTGPTAWIKVSEC